MAGEWLVKGVYVAIEIEELPGGDLQGYSPALDLTVRWERGELRFCDLGTGRPIATVQDERAAHVAEARANAEQQSCLAAEARVREIEDLLRRQNP